MAATSRIFGRPRMCRPTLPELFLSVNSRTRLFRCSTRTKRISFMVLTPELFHGKLCSRYSVLFLPQFWEEDLAMADEHSLGPHSRRVFLRFAFAAVGGATAATLLSACGPGQAPSGAAPPTAAGAPPTAAAAATAAPAAKPTTAPAAAAAAPTATAATSSIAAPTATP